MDDYLARSARPLDAARSQGSHITRPTWVQRRERSCRDSVWLHGLLGKIPRVQAWCVLWQSACCPRTDQCTAARMGTQVIVPYREEDEKRHLKPMGDLGQIVSMVPVL